MTLEKSLAYAKQHHSRFVDQLGELISIPSISTSNDHHGDMQNAADFIAAYLENLGVKHIQFFGRETHPIIYGDILSAGPNAPTVLIYGHYDVQPAEPLDKWDSQPFSPTVRGENLYARGSSDMKGQVMASIYAIEAILKNGKLPINIKFMIEGEEEIGSPSLDAFITEHKDLIAADYCLNPDTGMLGPNTPSITYALRGLAYFELRVTGPKQDLHSGLYGGAIHNPAQAITELIAGMHDENGMVTLPGFYDRVRELEAEERAELSRMPIDEKIILERSGVPELWGEKEYTLLERLGARPTLEINGLYSGYIEPGQKTVLPAYAMAKISMRLVPDQDPTEVRGQLEAYLKNNAPATIKWELIEMDSGWPSISNRNSKGIQAISKAQETVWGTQPIFRREGGSVPVVASLQKIAGIESINIGFGLPDDNMHGPNEKLHLPTFHKGIDAIIHFIHNLTE
jgi:acetylornithine deacetylase/succinyl-diaminopimelate desuccinylase-like protein